MSRPSGRLQLAPAGHVRSIVNSVRERVREKRALCDGMSDAFKSQHYKQNLLLFKKIYIRYKAHLHAFEPL